MTNKIEHAAVFMVGAVIGSLIAWHLLKTKYEQVAQEEIDSVKDAFARKESGNTGGKQKFASEKDKPDISEYADMLQQEGYVNYSDMSKKEDSGSAGKPYVIPPEEFGEMEGYEKISLNFFADRVLTDDDYELVEDVDGTVGIGSLEHFGEYEDDSVFVRNDGLRCDFEILQDHRTYADVQKTIPHLVEEE